MDMNLRQRVLFILLLGFISIGLLSPIASNTYLPASLDYGVHTAAVIQAKMGLDEGQFPLRIAPWQDNGWGNAFFAFYSPLPYTVAGYIYKLFPSANPFFIVKFLMWFALVLGGMYIYRLMRWLLNSSPAALLSSVAYITAPYFLININARGDLTETIAQGLLPLVLFYTLKTYREGFGYIKNLFTAFAWAALLLTHIITFVYSSVFVALFLLLLTLNNRSAWKRLLWTGAMYGLACLLTLWYTAPILATLKYLPISAQLNSPYLNNWLTPLSTLLSPAAVSPIPLPGNKLLPMPLYASIGWPSLFGVAVLVYLLVQNKLVFIRSSKRSLCVLIALFMFSLFLTWSPVDVWKFTPSFLSIAQFSYRLLAQTMWLGVMIFGFAILEIFRGRFRFQQTALGIVLLVFCASSWLPTNQSSPLTINQIKHNPTLGYAQHTYILTTRHLKHLIIASGSDLPLVDTSNWLVLNTPLTLPTHLFVDTPNAALKMSGTLPGEFFKEPVQLQIAIDGKTAYTQTINPGKFTFDLPLKPYLNNTNKNFALSLSVDKAFVPSKVDPSSQDSRSLALLIDSLQVTNLPPHLTTVPFNDPRLQCSHYKASTYCTAVSGQSAGLVQLPILYYPRLLNIKVDDENVAYFPIVYRDFVLAGVALKPGVHHISMQFVGLGWANWVSGFLWLGCIGIVLARIFVKLFNRRRSLAVEVIPV